MTVSFLICLSFYTLLFCSCTWWELRRSSHGVGFVLIHKRRVWRWLGAEILWAQDGQMGFGLITGAASASRFVFLLFCRFYYDFFTSFFIILRFFFFFFFFSEQYLRRALYPTETNGIMI